MPARVPPRRDLAGGDVLAGSAEAAHTAGLHARARSPGDERDCARPRADHSQAINEFCADFGVPKKVNQALIKKAKIVGSDLGFLS